MLSFPTHFVFLILLLNFESNNAAKCEDPWKGWRGHCYYFSPIRQNFDEAEKTCYGFDSFMVSIRSVEEFRFIAKMIQKLEASASTQGWFIGIKQINVTGSDTYRWVDGSVSGFRLWLVNQPNNVYEQCVMMDGTAGYRWRDELCRERAYFICRKDVGAMQCYEGNVDGAREYDVSAAQCLEQCRGQGYKVAALSVVRCACFQSMDTKYFKKRPRHKCNARCAGQHCGPKGFFAVYSIEYYPELAKTCDDLRDIGVSKPGVYILQKDQAAAKKERKKNEGIAGTRCFMDSLPKGPPPRTRSPHSSSGSGTGSNKMASDSASTTTVVPIPFWKKNRNKNAAKDKQEKAQQDGAGADGQPSTGEAADQDGSSGNPANQRRFRPPILLLTTTISIIPFLLGTRFYRPF